MFSSEDDDRYGLTYQTDRRLYALRFWTRRVFSATVDQFLAFLQYSYGPLCLLPVLADSVQRLIGLPSASPLRLIHAEIVAESHFLGARCHR